mmetsp:Transcript_22584/g.51744  ORF Transcript_22584/g.51744 Transcript_22584/m.51744 type:complete len:153 (-) Transcript_22584:540-998(-)
MISASRFVGIDLLLFCVATASFLSSGDAYDVGWATTHRSLSTRPSLGLLRPLPPPPGRPRRSPPIMRKPNPGKRLVWTSDAGWVDGPRGSGAPASSPRPPSKKQAKLQRLERQRTAGGSVDSTKVDAARPPSEQKVQVQTGRRGNKVVTMVR